jgi:hypothetical protein
MDKIQAAVSLALRDTEICIAAAEVEELPKHHDESAEDDRRVVAVVTHNYFQAMDASDNVDDPANAEQGDEAEVEEGW